MILQNITRRVVGNVLNNIPTSNNSDVAFVKCKAGFCHCEHEKVNLFPLKLHTWSAKNFVQPVWHNSADRVIFENIRREIGI